MINYIWGFFLVFGIIYAGFCGNIEFVTESAIKAAQDAVLLSLNLLGMMCLWLGLMNIAKQAGMIRFLAKNLKPLLRLIFPSIPANHPALGAIVMTIIARSWCKYARPWKCCNTFGNKSHAAIANLK